MPVSLLADFPEFIPILAPEQLAHWIRFLPGETLATRTERLRTHLQRDTLPMAWVAHQDGELFGTAALRTHDLEGREDLSPWLGGVFVREKYRGKGVASRLCRVVEKKAWAMGHETLHLFTLDQEPMYRHLGWTTREPVVWHGACGVIMTKRRPAPN